MCIFCQTYITGMITKKVHEIETYQIDDATDEIEEKIKQTWFVITMCTFLSIASGFVLFISYVIPTPEDNDFIWCFKLVNLYVPQWETFIVCCLMKPAVFGLTYVGVSIPAFAVFYYHGHIQLQKLMFKHALQNINLNCSDLTSTSYQQEVNTRLVRCARSYIFMFK